MKHVVLTLYLSLLYLGSLLAQPGTSNPSFNPLDIKNQDRADGEIKIVAFQPDGKLIVGGWFEHYDEVSTGGLVRLDANGNLDKSFKTGNGIYGYVFDALIQPDGKILVAGSIWRYNDTTCVDLIRLLPNGAIDKTFQYSSGSDLYLNKIALQPDTIFNTFVIKVIHFASDWNTFITNVNTFIPDWNTFVTNVNTFASD